jgi:dihydrofolate synthase/folylpolyglutamate synthase
MGITLPIVEQGLKTAFWPGRMEEVLPDVYLDGAHNADGFRAFLDTVSSDGYDGSRILLFGAVSDKPYDEMLLQAEQSRLFERIVLTKLKNTRSADYNSLSAANRAMLPISQTIYASAEEALEQLRRSQQGRIYIAGSLYLVGEIKELLADNQAAYQRSQDT